LPGATPASGPSIRFPSEPRQRISISSYPFREFIAGDHHKSGNPIIDLKDFAAHVVEKFNVNKIEPWTGHFPSTNPKYLKDFRKAVEKAGAALVNMTVSGKDSAYAADRDEREKAIAHCKKWVDVAVAIGSPSIRTNIAPVKDVKPDVERLAESLRRRLIYVCRRLYANEPLQEGSHHSRHPAHLRCHEQFVYLSKVDLTKTF
jgi:hypothetical protein